MAADSPPIKAPDIPRTASKVSQSHGWAPIGVNVRSRYTDKGSRGRTVTLKMKFNDFEIITRSRSVPLAVSSREDLERLSVALLQNEIPVTKPVRLLGISLSSLQADDRAEPQLGLPI